MSHEEEELYKKPLQIHGLFWVVHVEYYQVLRREGVDVRERRGEYIIIADQNKWCRQGEVSSRAL